MEEEWEDQREDIVFQGNLAKFTQHPDLRDYLLGTGDRVLVEASPTDRVWGVGLRMGDPRLDDPLRWRGENLLGFSLVRVRAALLTKGV